MRRFIGSVLVILCLVAGCSPAPGASTPAATPLPATAAPAPTATPAAALPTPTVSPWYQPLDPSFAQLQYRYAHVVNPSARFYLSEQDALQSSLESKRLPQADAYVAYDRKVTAAGQVLYHLSSGDWMRGADLQEITPSSFSGVLLTGPPTARFGWVLEAATSVDAAGNPLRDYARYQVVREDASAPARAGYLAIGSGEYLPLAALSLLAPGYRPPADVSGCRFVVVDLARQNLGVYEGCRPVFATLISSGRPSAWTPTGTFTVFRKTDISLVTSPFQGGDQYYLQGVTDMAYFYGFWALHAAYWHDRFGYPASHGCINLSPADAAWLFRWITVGDRVIVLPKG